MELSDLILLADSALNPELTEDDFIIKLEEYTEAFDKWFTKNSHSLRTEAAKWDQQALDALVSKHEEIANKTQILQDRAPEDMRKLKRKGKGIMAYVDILPKSIGFTKVKKG